MITLLLIFLSVFEIIASVFLIARLNRLKYSVSLINKEFETADIKLYSDNLKAFVAKFSKNIKAMIFLKKIKTDEQILKNIINIIVFAGIYLKTKKQNINKC